MVRIEPQGSTHEASELHEVFEQLRNTRGGVPTMYRILAHHPAILRAHRAYFHAALDTGNLSRAFKEKIAFRVAVVSGSAYSTASHRRYALQHGVSSAELNAIEQGDYSSLQGPESAALEFADEVSLSSTTVSDSTFSRLSTYFDSPDIVEISALVSVMILASKLGTIFDLAPDPTDEEHDR